MTGHFVGDDAAEPATPLPPLGPGQGALLVVYWFTSVVRLVVAGQVVDERPAHDRWTARPEVRVDGAPVPASWSGWWYPLPAGPHQLAVAAPAPARLRVDLPVGAWVPVTYRARLAIRTTDDRAGGGELTGTAALTAGSPRPGRPGRRPPVRSPRVVHGGGAVPGA